MAAATMRLRGDVVLGKTGDLYERILTVAGDPGVDELALDFSEVERFDASGAIAVRCGERALSNAGKRLSLQNLRDRHRTVLDMAPLSTRELKPRPHVGLLELAGESTLRGASHMRCLLQLLRDSLHVVGRLMTRRERLPGGSSVEQLSRLGADAVPIVSLLALLLGLILGVQAVARLSEYGASEFAAELVGLALVRELGPMLIAIVIIGRDGAAITSELGTMQVNQEIDALRTMGIDPVRFLVLPRLTALFVAQPALTLLGVFAGIFGGMIVALLMADIPMSAYLHRTIETVGVMDLAFGLSKSLVYAVVIGGTACALGLDTHGGASEVGRATTTAVVMMILLVVVSDFGFAAGEALVRLG